MAKKAAAATIKAVHISVICEDGGTQKHVAIDIYDADKLGDHPKLSPEAASLLSLLGAIIAGQDDAGKVEISAASEADAGKPTHLLKGKKTAAAGDAQNNSQPSD